MALSYTSLNTTTQEVWRKVLADNIYDKSTLLKIMLMDERVVERGGEKIFEPIKYAKSTSVGAYTRFGTFDISDQDNLTKAAFDWAFYYANVTISGQDAAKNDGDRAILDLLATKIEEAEMTLRDHITTELYAGTTDIIGLSTAVDATGTYGGIALADFAGWAAGEDNTSYSQSQLIDASDPTKYIKDLFAKAVRTATHLGQKPNLIIVPLIVWDIYESVLETQSRYPKGGRGEKIAAAGFSTLMFRDIPVVADEKCTAGSAFFLNTDFMAFNVLDKKNFEWSGFKEPANGDSRIGQFTLGCQLSITNRRMFYKFTGLPTS